MSDKQEEAGQNPPANRVGSAKFISFLLRFCLFISERASQCVLTPCVFHHQTLENFPKFCANCSLVTCGPRVKPSPS